MFCTLIRHGHNIDDIKWKYTIDQVYFFFEGCKKLEMEDMKNMAFVVSNSMILSSPVYSQSDLSKRRQAWQKFIRSLTWSDLEKKAEKKTINDYVGMFGAVGVKIKNKSRGDT